MSINTIENACYGDVEWHFLYLNVFPNFLMNYNMQLNEGLNFLTYLSDYVKIISMSDVAMTNIKLL